MRKIVLVDGRATDLFVLSETGNRLVYIPVRDLMDVDVNSLTEISKRSVGTSMLEVMSETKLATNGLNALVQYDKLIQVADVDEEGKATRMRKPTDPRPRNESKGSPNEATDLVRLLLEFMNRSEANTAATTRALQEIVSTVKTTVVQKPAVQEQEQRAKPGPKPGWKKAKEESQAQGAAEEDAPSVLVSPSE